MLQRPSVNQITSAYTGRMPELREQVEKDKQANNGLPSDLRKLMALQDLLSGDQHMGIDQALKAPQNPATVNQSLQDRARQILGTKMAQAQQGSAIAKKQQEAMVNQGRPGPVPEGVAQPERQPEGIDQLTSNVGESYANGGIVAFTRGGNLPSSGELEGVDSSETYDLLAEKTREKARKKAEQELKDKIKFLEVAAPAVAERVKQETAANPQGTNLAEAAPASVTDKPVITPYGQSKALNVLDGKPPASPKTKIAKTTDQPSIANLPAVADLLPPVLPTPEKGSPRDVMGKSMTLDPDAEMNRILAAREKLVGAPDTSQYQALIEELRGQRAKLQKKPEPGFESLMEYFGEIAAGPTVGRSGKAGAQASERLRQRELEKEKQANALSERMIEAAQKQQDAIYGYKKEGFALSEGERARVFKERFDAAKAAGESDDRARQMAQQAVLEREKMKQQAQLERERNASNIRAAGIGRQGQLMEMAQALMKADTTGQLTLAAALEQAAKIVGTSALAGTSVRNEQAYDKAVEALDNSMIGIIRRGTTPAAKDAQREYDAKILELRQRYGLDGAAGLNSLQPAAGPSSSNIRSQADAILSGGR